MSNTLESIRDHEDSVQYFTGVTNYVTLAAIFNFCQHSFTFWQEACPLHISNTHVNSHAHQSEHPSATSHMYVSRSMLPRRSSIKPWMFCIPLYRLNPVVFWPDRYSIKISLQLFFLRNPWNWVVPMINCFKIFTDRPSSSDASAAARSSYKHNTIKYLISSMLHVHMYHFKSKGWG